MKIIGVIPARYQSSRFPGKPLADICGRPMIWWVYQQAKKVAAFDEVYVATDDERIAAACDKYGMACEMTSSGHATGTDRVAEVARRRPADLYVNVQGDEPLIEPEIIQAVIEPFLAGERAPGGEPYEVFTLMSKIEDPVDMINPTVGKVVAAESGLALYISRMAVPYPQGTAQLDYCRALGMFAFTPGALEFFARTPRGKIESIESIEILRFIENGVRVHFSLAASRSIAVDLPRDLDKVRKAMESPC